MKKIFSFLLMSAMLLAVAASVASCSDNDDDDGIISEQRVERYVTGYKWYLDSKKKTEFRFYRNRLVSRMSSGGSVASGQLTYDASNFFGTWAVVDGKLVTTFTTGPYEDSDLNSILYGSLTIDEFRSDCKIINVTDPDGYSHDLGSYGMNNRFVDYTDASDHDGALEGTWEALAHKGERNIIFTIKIGKQGKITFIAKSENIDFTTTCTTKNGHVTFTHLFEPGTNPRSLIYIREKDEIRFYSEENAQSVWTWEKVN